MDADPARGGAPRRARGWCCSSAARRIGSRSAPDARLDDLVGRELTWEAAPDASVLCLPHPSGCVHLAERSGARRAVARGASASCGSGGRRSRRDARAAHRHRARWWPSARVIGAPDRRRVARRRRGRRSTRSASRRRWRRRRTDVGERRAPRRRAGTPSSTATASGDDGGADPAVAWLQRDCPLRVLHARAARRRRHPGGARCATGSGSRLRSAARFRRGPSPAARTCAGSSSSSSATSTTRRPRTACRSARSAAGTRSWSATTTSSSADDPRLRTGRLSCRSPCRGGPPGGRGA